MYPNVHCNIIYNNKEMEITLLSLNRPMNKEKVAHMCTHTHIHKTVEYYSAIENKIFPFGTIWMNLEGIMFVK